MGSKPCRPYETYVHVGFGKSENPRGRRLRPESHRVRRECDGSLKGGHFGLSLGRLLSKGGMMSPVAGSPALLWSAVPGKPCRRQRGVNHDDRNPRTKSCNSVTR